MQAVEKARTQFGERILIEGGITLINELIDHTVIDQLELSVTPASGGDDRIDWKTLLAKFAHCQSREVDGTTFYSAHN
jgi:riboflavin biosynthesis pyrimidine reductase